MCLILCCALTAYVLTMMMLILLLCFVPGFSHYLPMLLSWGWDFLTAFVFFFADIVFFCVSVLMDLLTEICPLALYCCECTADGLLYVLSLDWIQMLQQLTVFDQWKFLISSCFNFMIFIGIVCACLTLLHKFLQGENPGVLDTEVWEGTAHGPADLQERRASEDERQNESNRNTNRQNTNSGVRNQRERNIDTGPRDPSNDNNKCVICFEKERDTALFPCGHTQICATCTRAVQRRNNLCPVCQQRIREYRHIYI